MGQNDKQMGGDATPYQQARVTQSGVHLASRAAGSILLLILAGVLWVYGFNGEIRNPTTNSYPTTGLSTTPSTQTVLGDLLVLSSIFVVIGFGLLLSYFKRATFSALYLSLMTVSLTIIVSPIFQKFWFNILITDFKGATPTTKDPSRILQYSMGGNYIYVDFYNLRIALANSIAQLVTALALFGRMNPLQVVINSFGFNFCWNLNHFLCAFLAIDSPDSRLYDDYQINSIYLFAACYGSIASFFLRQPSTALTPEFSSTNNSTVTAHIGTFFLFLAFCSTSTLFSTKYTLTTNETQRLFIWQEAFIATFIALSASVISNYAFSILLNYSSRIGIRGSLVGTITGAIVYGPVAGTCINIGAAIACGLLAGLISAFFFQKILPALNANSVKDSFGMISILLVSFTGTFFISPIVLKTYYNYSVDLPTLYSQNNPTTNYFINSQDSAGWSLVYVGVSSGIGLLSGLIMGFLLRTIQRSSVKYFDDAEVFKSSSYGLREPLPAMDAPGNLMSAQNLKHGE